MGKDRVGRIAQTNLGICAFEYDQDYLTTGTSISPFELPLKNGVMMATRSPFDGNFGVFDDCLPDGWGRLLLDRYLQKQGIKPNSLSTLDRLTLVGSSGRGALEFLPDQSVLSNGVAINFEHLAAETKKILASDNYQGDSLDSLYQ